MIILMGLAGSGKSTQGQILAKTTGRVWLSAGQVLRDTPDPEVHELQRQGELVPDSLTIPLMMQAMAVNFAAGKDLVLDGYPRTLEQTAWMVQQAADRIEMVLKINVPRPELIRRLELRGRADDQTRAAIEERFRVVETHLTEICQMLTEHGIRVKDVDGTGSIEDVQQRIIQAITEVENE